MQQTSDELTQDINIHAQDVFTCVPRPLPPPHLLPRQPHRLARLNNQERRIIAIDEQELDFKVAKEMRRISVPARLPFQYAAG